MRILQIFNRYEQFGGEEAAVQEIEAALSLNHEVRTHYGSTREMMGSGLAGKLQAPVKAVWNRRVFHQLRQIQAKEQYDLWLVHNVFPGLSPSVYDSARTMGVPVVQYLHNYRFACINGFLLNHGQPCQRCLNGNFLPAVQTKCWQESRSACATMGISLSRLRSVGVLKQIAHWIAISQAQKTIHTRIGIPEQNISVIYHFFNGEVSRAPTDGREILYLGRLSPEKGVDLLVDAFLKAPLPDRKLLVVGEGPLRQELQKRSSRRSDIEFKGFLTGPELHEVWRRSALTVVPSIWEEAFGRVLIESWAHGIPVLAARSGALAELVDNTGAGWLCNPREAGELGKRLHEICADPVSLRRAGQACGPAASRFDRSSWLASIEVVLENAVRSSLKLGTSNGQPRT